MAMMKVAGRWLAQGLVVSTALAMATTPLSAKTNSYGGYDIVGDTGVDESGYADVKGWVVSKGEINGTFAYCMAHRLGRNAMAGRRAISGQVGMGRRYRD